MMHQEFLPPSIQQAVEQRLADWDSGHNVARLWQGDANLWTGADEAKWLGWLTIPNELLADAATYAAFQEEVHQAGFTHLLLLGMGGSSLAPEVFRLTLKPAPNSPKLAVLDSTDPRQIAATEANLDLTNTLVIVSTKSGGTLEPNILKDYFFEKVVQAVGAKEAPKRFVAVTDPNSSFEKVATQAGFRRVFHGVPSIGGRYSVLSAFGMVPAAAAGMAFRMILSRAVAIAAQCRPEVAVADNPGLKLGVILGECALTGQDKLTFILSPSIASLGTWLEQLIAESTGKQGLGIIPIDREPIGAVGDYGHDRLFAYLHLAGDADAEQKSKVEALAKAGHAVVEIRLDDVHDIGREFFRWEFATAVAGAILGINPFDQPDVEASKIETKKLTERYEAEGELPPETPRMEVDGIKVYANDLVAKLLRSPSRLADVMTDFLNQIESNDYFAILAYLPMTGEHERLLTEIRLAVRAAKRVATCGEFGPRFLHSTGQAYKGGPNSGVFLQLTCDEPNDLAVPGKKYTFGIVKAAQARGDLAVLDERGRRALRLHLGADVTAGLTGILQAVKNAVTS